MRALSENEEQRVYQICDLEEPPPRILDSKNMELLDVDGVGMLLKTFFITVYNGKYLKDLAIWLEGFVTKYGDVDLYRFLTLTEYHIPEIKDLRL